MNSNEITMPKKEQKAIEREIQRFKRRLAKVIKKHNQVDDDSISMNCFLTPESTVIDIQNKTQNSNLLVSSNENNKLSKNNFTVNTITSNTSCPPDGCIVAHSLGDTIYYYCPSTGTTGICTT